MNKARLIIYFIGAGIGYGFATANIVTPYLSGVIMFLALAIFCTVKSIGIIKDSER